MVHNVKSFVLLALLVLPNRHVYLRDCDVGKTPMLCGT